MVSLLFSFRGRIGRKQYWLATSLVGLLSFVGQMLAFSPGSLAGDKDTGDAVASALSSSALSLPINMLVLWCTLAIQFKRFHDRGRTGWLSMIPLALILFGIITIVSNVFSKAPLEQTFSDLMPVIVLLLITGLAFFIDLGCMPSVEGPNTYGPPPGAAGPTEPTRPGGAVDAASALFGAQSAMDRAIAEAQNPQRAAPALAAATPAPGAGFAHAAPQPDPTGFGRRATR